MKVNSKVWSVNYKKPIRKNRLSVKKDLSVDKSFYYYLEIFPVKTDFTNPYIDRNDEYMTLTECYHKLLNVSGTGVIYVSSKDYVLPGNPQSIMLYKTLESKKRIELSDFSVCDSSVKWKRLQEAPKESNK